MTRVCDDDVTYAHPIQHCVSDVPVERDLELSRLLARLVVISAIMDLVNEIENE